MSRQWGIRSTDGQFYQVGTYQDGEWKPGTLLRTLREWFLLREFGSYPRYKRIKR